MPSGLPFEVIFWAFGQPANWPSLYKRFSKSMPSPAIKFEALCNASRRKVGKLSDTMLIPWKPLVSSLSSMP